MLPGDGRGRALQRGRRAPAPPPQPLPLAPAALQHSRGSAGGPADPSKSPLRWRGSSTRTRSDCSTLSRCVFSSQALKDDFPLSHVISPFTNQERREGMLLNLLIPFVLTVGSGSKGDTLRPVIPLSKKCSLASIICPHTRTHRQPPPGAVRDLPASPDCHQHPSASSDHLHLAHQELHAGRVPGSLLHPGRRGQGPAPRGFSRVHQSGCVPGYERQAAERRACSCLARFQLSLLAFQL